MATHIYHNIFINNNTNDIIPATYEENRVIPILNDPSEYDLSVIRFQVPLSEVPIFTFIDNEYMIAIYYKTATHGNLYFEKWVNYINNNTVNTPPNKNEIYDYVSFLQMINTALLSAWSDIHTLEPTTVVLNQAPYLRKSVNNQNIFELVIPQSAVNNCIVYFNQQLAYYFDSLPSNSSVILSPPDGLNPSPGQSLPTPPASGIFRTLPAGYQRCYGYNNTAFNQYPYIDTGCLGWENKATAYTSFSIVQEFQTLTNWNDALGLVFTTSTIPVIGDAYSIPSSSSFGSNVTQKIITDFQINAQLGPESRGIVDYVPFGEYRLMPLNSSFPLSTMNISVNWIDTEGIINPLYISPRNSINLKIMYRKKKWKVGDPIIEKYIK